MERLCIDFTKSLGPIKKVNGVGQPPILGITDASMFRFLGEANIPYSRLHDVGGAFGSGCYVDVPNVFPNFDADETNPENYEFAHTDWVISELMRWGVEPVYRLGITIENAVERYASPRVYPPKDFAKWARICEHIIRHYNEGWANGFRYHIEYWEIWNEPDNHVDVMKNQMWRGTKEQYFELYEVSANYLKRCFPNIKVGGPASCGFYALNEEKQNARNLYFIEFFKEFLAWISSPQHKAPLDFCSWHSYDTVENTRKAARYCKELLREYGFDNVETQLNEWNPIPLARDSIRHAVSTAAMLLMMQDEPVDTAMLYDARVGTSIYGSLFNPLTFEPFAEYDAFMMFGKLLKLGTQVELETDAEGVYAVAAANETEGGVMIVNTAQEEKQLVWTLPNETECKVTDAARRLKDAALVQNGCLSVPAEAMVYVKVIR